MPSAGQKELPKNVCKQGKQGTQNSFCPFLESDPLRNITKCDQLSTVESALLQRTHSYIHLLPTNKHQLSNFDFLQPPLNILGLQRYLAQFFSLLSGTTSEGQRKIILIITFLDHPNVNMPMLVKFLFTGCPKTR